MLKGINYNAQYVVWLNVRVEDANLSESERSLSLAVWSSVWRTDPGRRAEVEIPRHLDAASRSSKTVKVALVLPVEIGDDAKPWPADATMWIGARTWAKSEEGPLVGGRAGCGGVRLQDLRDHLARGSEPIVVELFMTQPGIPGKGKRYRKMNVSILSLADDASKRIVDRWSCARTIGPTDFVAPNMPLHDDLLNEHVNVAMFPYTDVAKEEHVFFHPSHRAVEPIHAPLWLDNVAVPGFAFWMQTGVPRYDRAMADFMETAAHTTLTRHDWPRGIPGAPNNPAAAAFVAVVNSQFAHTAPNDAEYDDTFTYAVAALMDTCALLAVSMFYRFDEVYRVDQHWFREPSSQKAQTESFQDALSMAGGDCEDVGSLIHRVFRWLQLGDPARRDASRYWTAFGGWKDPVLDAMQRIAYWYVSGGTLGSVTAARYSPQPGGVPQLLINSSEDEKLPVGGHMWQEAIPVWKFEQLVRRMNASGAGGRVRPEYLERTKVADYPGWVKFLPHTIGEGTGSVYPLVLPLVNYMHSREGRAAAQDKHQNMIFALKRLQHKTTVLGRMQIERWSDRSKPVPDARVNYFYRRATKFSTDDLALHHIPRFDFIWTRKHRRRSDGGWWAPQTIGAPFADSDSDSDDSSSSSGSDFVGAGFTDSGSSSSSSSTDEFVGAGSAINGRSSRKKKKAKKAKKAKKPKKDKTEKKARKEAKKAKKARKKEERRAEEEEEAARDEHKKDSLRKRVKKKLIRHDAFGNPIDGDSDSDDSSSSSGFVGASSAAATHRRALTIGVPGEGDVGGSLPEWGVSMRDRVLASNLAVSGGGAHPDVALTPAPPVTQEEMAAFQARIAHLAPWRQPWRDANEKQALEDKFAGPIAEFQHQAEEIVKDQLAHGGVPSGATLTRVNVIFRRDTFLRGDIDKVALQDLARLEGDLARVETTFEFLEKWIFNVRVSLWLVDGGFAPEESVV